MAPGSLEQWVGETSDIVWVKVKDISFCEGYLTQISRVVLGLTQDGSGRSVSGWDLAEPALKKS